MLNLLPAEQKLVLRKEYSNRRIVVWLGAIIAVLAISIVLLSPSYFLTRIRAQQAKAELEVTKKALDAKLPPAEMVAEIQSAVRTAQDLRPLAQSRSVYNLVDIFENHPPSIKITNISFTEGVVETGVPARISLGGWAKDRESLTAFGRSLEEREEFAVVDVPVSNFVKESNITFTLSITLKQ